MTGSSNKERVIVCLRCVDSAFNVREHFIGLYHVNNIKTDIILAALKDIIL